jgi:hypothetical protein
MGMGEGMVVITAMQANSRAGVYLGKELYKKHAKKRHDEPWKENTRIQVLSTQKSRQRTY